VVLSANTITSEEPDAIEEPRNVMHNGHLIADGTEAEIKGTDGAPRMHLRPRRGTLDARRCTRSRKSRTWTSPVHVRIRQTTPTTTVHAGYGLRAILNAQLRGLR